MEGDSRPHFYSLFQSLSVLEFFFFDLHFNEYSCSLLRILHWDGMFRVQYVELENVKDHTLCLGALRERESSRIFNEEELFDQRLEEAFADHFCIGQVPLELSGLLYVRFDNSLSFILG